MKGRGDLFSEGRKALPHSIERQLGLEILHSTAPEENLRCNGNLLCLHRAPEHGIGGVRQVVKIVLRPSEKRSPRPDPNSVGTDDFFKALNCYRVLLICDTSESKDVGM